MIADKVIEQFCEDKISGVLATVISTDGLGPAQKGDCLFWAAGKLLAGTVGGGANEKQVLEACARLAEKQKVLKIISPLAGSLPSCGGLLEVRLDRLDLAQKEDIVFFKKQQKDTDSSKLLLFGAGHVVQELAWLADRNGFSSVVVDPRSELLLSENFPADVNLVCCPVDKWLQKNNVAKSDYIIIAGPDHATDLAVLEQAATTQAHYIGVMGSKRKIESFTKVLRKKSLFQFVEGRLFAPIGLKIPSKRPSEVAVSIVAELISVRAALLKNII